MSAARGSFTAKVEEYDSHGGVGEREAEVKWEYSRTVDVLTIWIDGSKVLNCGPLEAAAVKKAIEESGG